MRKFRCCFLNNRGEKYLRKHLEILIKINEIWKATSFNLDTAFHHCIPAPTLTRLCIKTGLNTFQKIVKKESVDIVKAVL